ncbi:MAG: hypothetical protein DWQ19_09610 [Crenarchaeota archaeon]|nr:MAG: hypothetical protein DWQ19_09610 [Thermoproteota archaeon]
MKYILILILLLSGCGSNDPKVIGIIDGDTIKILQDGEEVKVRLAEIDCPERKQPFHTQAKKYTSELVFGKKVEIKNGGWDRYHRLIAIVILPDGRVLNKELVRAGYAWQYDDYSKDKSYGDLEEEARKAKKGLWLDKNPIPPWEFRKKKR